MAPVDGIPTDIAKIAGPIVIAFMLNSILYGVLVVQVYLYYLAFPKDRGLVQCLVYAVFLLNSLQCIIFYYNAFTVFGAGFGDLTGLNGIRLSGFSIPIITGLVSLMVQSFYALQMRTLSRSNILVGFVVIIGLISTGASIYTGCLSFLVDNHRLPPERILVPCLIWMAGSALCDTMIALVMTIYLLRVKAVMKSTRLLVARTVRLFIETGTATAAVAIIDCILTAVVSKYPFHMLPCKIMAKLYANTFMFILNNRIRIVGGRDEATLNPTIINDWPQSSVRFALSSAGNTNTSPLEAELEVFSRVTASWVECPRRVWTGERDVSPSLSVLDINVKDPKPTRRVRRSL
ncbi:hypothetical protein L218DRAFT_768736 [Marasmius fiardii PR-910]|nr:hypothetical protein L218DRAFT_768736 [Marasmius fiardii PR-910]